MANIGHIVALERFHPSKTAINRALSGIIKAVYKNKDSLVAAGYMGMSLTYGRAAAKNKKILKHQC